MTLKDLLKKKNKIGDNGSEHLEPLPPPEFKFIRSTTTSQEVISPPSYPGDAPPPKSPKEDRKSRFRKGSSASTASHQSVPEHETAAKKEHRLSSRLHLRHRSRTLSSGSGSENVPDDLPDVDSTAARADEEQAQWEKRATLLARGNSISSRPPSTPGSIHSPDTIPEGQVITINLSDEGGDENIQQAIRLHEAGDYERATAMFGRLADPSGANNALSQVLFGLALRHGWGCTPNPEEAVTYLSYAASNSANIEDLALKAGMKKGGAAKGELVLAMYELANSFRNGWGVKKDPVAAKQYYETAANLGDTDAMNEVAWCYLEGFGCKKDKFKAAQYLRLAEEKGSKTLGNTWIWKEKYNPPS